ncbi:MAG: hypothetical protein ABIH72_01285 [archaeon]
MAEKLSLYKFCALCNSKCCKDVGGIGSPILTKEERDEYEKVREESTKKIKCSGGEYFLLKTKNGTNQCIFLSDNGKCEIQEIKPMDCACYPIKAIYKNNEIIFILDSDCLASAHLSEEFIEKAKKVALESVKRFDKKIFQHWLDNYIGWVTSTGEKMK